LENTFTLQRIISADISRRTAKKWLGLCVKNHRSYLTENIIHLHYKA
jgi:hypothetical protein